MATGGDNGRRRRRSFADGETMTSITSQMTTTTLPTATSTDTGFLRSLALASATIVASFCVLALLWH